MPRPQFTLRSLLVAMLVVAAFFAGIRFERERDRREHEARLFARLSSGQRTYVKRTAEAYGVGLRRIIPNAIAENPPPEDFTLESSE
jgi:hypothetical protein